MPHRALWAQEFFQSVFGKNQKPDRCLIFGRIGLAKNTLFLYTVPNVHSHRFLALFQGLEAAHRALRALPAIYLAGSRALEHPLIVHAPEVRALWGPMGLFQGSFGVLSGFLGPFRAL